MRNNDFHYEIIKHIVTLSESGDTSKELNIVIYGDKAPKYDLRTWRRCEGKETLLKGLTLTLDEIKALKTALNSIKEI